MTDASTEFLALASRATAQFVEGGVPLDDAIAKLADERHLSPTQIQRIVELANHETNERLMKVAKDRTLRFPLASADGVRAKLGVSDEGTTKVGAVAARRSIRDLIGKTSEFGKLATLLGEPEQLATYRARTARTNLTKVSEWLTLHRRKCLAKQAGLHEDLRLDLGRLVQTARNQLANGVSLVDLHKFACSYDRQNGRMWDVLFGSVRSRLVKEADHFIAPLAKREIPKSTDVKHEVINGRHALLITLDTLRNKISEEDRMSQRLRLMDTQGPAVVTAIRKLNTGADVSKYLAEEIEKTAALGADVDQFLPAVEKLAGLLGKALGVGVPAAALMVGLHRASKQAGQAAREGLRPYRPAAVRSAAEGG